MTNIEREQLAAAELSKANLSEKFSMRRAFLLGYDVAENKQSRSTYIEQVNEETHCCQCDKINEDCDCCILCGSPTFGNVHRGHCGSCRSRGF